MTIYNVFDNVTLKINLLGFVMFSFIKCFNKYKHLSVFYMFQITRGVSLMSWENSQYLNTFIPTLCLRY